MRFTIPALNNDYFDEDYLRVFGFPKMGKNVKVHRSVVFSNPASHRIGDNVTIGPYCVFCEESRVTIGNDVKIMAGCHFEGQYVIEDGKVLAPNTVCTGRPVVKKKPVVEEDEDTEVD